MLQSSFIHSISLTNSATALDWKQLLAPAAAEVLEARARRTFSRCSGIDQTRLALPKHRAVLVTVTAYVLSASGKRYLAIAYFELFLGRATTVFGIALPELSTSAVCRSSSARAVKAGGRIPGNGRSTWRISVSSVAANWTTSTIRFSATTFF